MRDSVSRVRPAVGARPHASRVKHALTGAALAGILVAPTALGAVSSFESGTEGWAASLGSVAWQAGAGNPGGFIRLEAPGFGPSAVASAASAFLGDQSHMLGGAFRFDAVVLDGPLSLDPTPGTPWSVSVTIVNDSMKSGVATRVFTDGVRLGDTWATLSAALVGAEWGVSDKTLALILAGVTNITVEVLPNEIPAPFAFGLDNVGIVPTPGAAALFALAGLALIARRRR